MRFSVRRRALSPRVRFLVGGLALAAPVAASVANPAHAALHTDLSFDAASYQADYSQGLSVSAQLVLSADGTTPVLPGACQLQGGQPCRVTFSIEATATPDDESLLVPEADPVIDAEGRASKRIVLVNGVHDDFAFVASDTGVSYTLTARFAGFGNPTVDECLPETPDNDDGDLCPAEATVTLTVLSEVPAIALTDGREGGLGDTIELSATVQDPNGNAELASAIPDGAAPLLLEGVTVRFFYDVDGDGRPDGNEEIGESVTNAAGVAAVTFALDPLFVRAGTFDDGIHAEFSGDDRYGVARASTRLIVRPAAVDAEATILEVDPKEVPADGNSTLEMRARLVDLFNNLLDETSEAHEVRFEADLGVLVGDVVRDPNNGSYTQTLRASREGGSATITVFVDDVKGSSETVTFVREGCQCGHADLTAFGPILALLALRRRRA